MDARAYAGANATMTGRIWLLLVLALLLGVLAHSSAEAEFRQPGEPYSLVGPVVVSVPGAGPSEKIFSFTTPSGVLGPFTLNVQNGVGTATLPVTAGTIWLDNIQIAGSNDFRPGVAGFSRTVDAGPGAHSLRVVLKGPVNSGVSLNLVGRKLLPIPVSASPSPTQIAVGTKASLAVTLYPAPEKPGKLLIDIAHGFVSAPSQVPFAAGQTQVQVPIRGKSLGLDTLKAKLRGRTVEVPVNVIPTNAKVASLSPSLATLATGGHATVTVALQSALPTSVYVDLATSPGGVISHPPTVLVPANTLQASFTIHGMASGSGQLTASLNGSQATSQFTVLNQSAGVASLQPVASQISAGASGNLTLSLTGTVNSNTGINLSAQPAGIVHVPSSVTVLAGTSQAQVPVQGQTPGTATVRADFNGSFAEAAVQVTSPPVEIASLEPSSLDVYADAEAALSLTLNSAQSEAVEVELVASPAGIISIPATVTVPAGALTTTFQAKALALGQAQVVATLNGKTRATTVNVIPHSLALVSLLPADLALQQGAPGTLTLNVNAAQAEAIAIPLSAAPAGLVQVPTSVLLPAGQTSVAVPVNAQAEGVASISASYNGTTVSAQVSVTPPPPVVSELAPPSVTTPKGRPATLTVKLDRVPNSPQVVALSSDMPSVASVPASVTVPAGTEKVDFPVTASQEGQAQITASLNGGSAAASVTVTPAEVVSIALSPIEHTAYVGDRVQYTAQGTYTDATQQDISGDVQWSSSNGNVAAIGVTGLADALSAGSAQIAAAKDGANQQTGLTVLAPPALSLSAAKTTVKEGETVTVTVTSAVPAEESGLEISFSGGGTGSLQLPLSVSIPAGETSVTFNVTGESPGQYLLTVSAPRRSDASLTFSIVAGLEITGLSPASGEAGSLIEIQGLGFDSDPAKNAVTFFGNATATLVEASSTSLRVKVPPLAQTGAITVATAKGTVQSPVFTVVRQQDFALTASPASQILLTSGQAVYSLALSSLGVESFTGLASLKVTGLPAGVTAKFSPLNLALSQPGALILTASSNAQLGSATLSVEATALVSGVSQTRTAQITVNVQSAVGVTGVKGRFVTPEGHGIAGVRVNVDDNQTVSDSAGNFLLTGLPGGKVTLRMDATPSNPLAPIWPAIVELESGKLTVLVDWVINPFPTDDKYKPLIQNSATEQFVSDERYPGVRFTIPAGGSIIGWDGVPKSRMAMERILPEKLPVPPPPIPIVEAYQLYFGTPMGGVPSEPIPVTLPNVAELEPGEKSNIWYFDGSPMGGTGEWKLAGVGTISADGKTVTTDPGQGIPRFCGVCGLPCQEKVPQGPKPPDDCGGDDNATAGGNGGTAGNPITLFNGQEMPQWGALSCGGIAPFSLGLKFNPVDAFQNIGGINGSMGWGWTLGYDVSFLPFAGDQKRLIMPGNRQINFVKEADGVYRNRDRRLADGMEMTPLAGVANSWVLKHKDGTRWTFSPFSPVVTRGAPVTFLTEITDPAGNSLHITRSSSGRIQTVGTSERRLSFSYGANGFADKVADTAGREVRFTYDAQDFISSITNADGGTTTYTYVGDDEFPADAGATACAAAVTPGGQRIKTIQYPGIATPTENFYGSSRRILRQTSRLGDTSIAYRVNGACIVHTSNLSKVCTANCPAEDSWDNHQAGWRFYGGQVTGARVIDPVGRSRRVAFDPAGRILEDEDFEGQITRNRYDSQGRLTQATDNLGRVSKHVYDATGNVISQQDALGRVTDTQHDPKWNLPTQITRYVDDGSAVTTQIQYHATFGQPTKLIDPENRATTLAYSPKGQLASLADPLGQQIVLAYNPAGDLVGMKDPLGNLTRLATDGAGRTVNTTTPKGYDWQQSWNGKSQPRVETDPTGGKIESVYDEAGRIVSIWDQNGNPVERYTYDERGNVIARTDALNQSDTYQYDAANRLTQTTSRKGEVVTFAYDGQDRLTQVSRPDGATSYSYDAAGRLIQVQEGSTRLQYEYDQADRLVREVQDTSNGYNSVEYQYDALDRRVSRKVNGGDETSYGWNKANQLSQVQFRGEKTTYQYDAAGRLVQKTLPGGIVQAYQYDAASRLTQIQYKNGVTLIDQLDLAYDAEGNIVSKKLANGGLNQDTALTASFDAANRMTEITVSGKTYALSYDANGNLTGKTNTADANDSTVYSWDARNRLAGITAPGLAASFQYDPLGRRIERTVNGETTSYLYDGVQAIGEVRAGQATALLTGLSIDEAIARYASAGRLTQLTDQLGSVIRQINEAGTTQSTTAYSPYGEGSTTGDDLQNSTEYTGRENDGTGLYFYRARYYDPILKRFISEDPIGTAGGINLMGYVWGIR
jgi:RHS repeat-associated protein